MLKKLTIFFLFLFVIFGVLGAWYYQRNVFSKEILKLEILGPKEISVGEEVEYLVQYKNNGAVNLEDVKLNFEYPENSLFTQEGTNRVEEELEDIYPGQEKTISFKARFFGKENDKLTARAWLTFRPKNLKAKYQSETSLTSIITSFPFTFGFDLPSKIENGREMEFALNYFSNSDFPLSNLGIRIEYPLGFLFIQSSPKGIEKNEWTLPILNKIEGGRIEIRGKLEGDVSEQKIFKASLGIWKEGNFVVLKEQNKGIEIIRPSIYISSQVNNSQFYTASLGDLLHYEIFYKNIGDNFFEDLFLAVRLEGEAFNLESLQTSDGQFQRGDNTIIWDWKFYPELKFLDVGQEKKVEFWVRLKDNLPATEKNKNIFVKLVVNLGQVREEFVTKINSQLEIVQKVIFNDQTFKNSGPIPPKFGETTNYTVFWQVKNYHNGVTNGKVRTALPQGVKLTGEMLPQDSKVTFDQISRQIVWEVGDLEAGDGITKPGPELAFQIAFTPSPDQVGQTPNLIGPTEIIAEDSWTQAIINVVAPGVNTTLPADPGRGGPVQ